jgi:hypothetical protein
MRGIIANALVADGDSGRSRGERFEQVASALDISGAAMLRLHEASALYDEGITRN